MNGAVSKLAVEPLNAGVSLRDQALPCIRRSSGSAVAGFIHMRAIRQAAIAQDNRADRSMTEHLAIVEAVERRDTDRAERLARSHTPGLAEHVERRCSCLE